MANIVKWDDLIKSGAKADTSYKKKTVKWDNDGEEYEFEIEVKKEMSAADFEFVFPGNNAATGDDKSYMARVVQRMVRLDGEHVDFDIAKEMKFSLLAVLVDAVDAMKEAVAPKKASPRQRKSGAN